ncbi:hypothetical protein [Pseudoduganella sp. UC29_71]|uniref:hypothetical protein n=1 Tax=Pseudoduganella sp. UC29_71 TaxID=3350174 RepID=UPI0036700E7B
MTRTLITALLLLSAAAHATAQPPAAPARQDLGAVRQAVEQFLQTQTVGLPGTVAVSVGAIDQRMALAPCPQLQTFSCPARAPGAKPRWACAVRPLPRGRCIFKPM